MEETSFSVSSALPATPPALPLIGTHSGNFHCDEALACHMLRLTPTYAQSDIIRTRNADLLKQCAVVVDVGGVYDPATHRFDHHQNTFDGTFGGPYTTRLSSAGLVYKHFGAEIIRSLLAREGLSVTDAQVPVVYDRIYRNFIEHIDAHDNGRSVSSDGVTLYNISTHLSARVGRLNPAWNEPDTESSANAQFKKAMAMAGAEFEDAVLRLVRHWLPARSIVEEAVRDRLSVDASGEVIHLTRFAPWTDHLFEIETEMGIEGAIKYVLFCDTSGMYRIQAVPAAPGSFACRLALPKEWRGLRDAELARVSGIPNTDFVHAAGFIGGGKTLDVVVQMARQSLQAGGVGPDAKRQRTE